MKHIFLIAPFVMALPLCGLAYGKGIPIAPVDGVKTVAVMLPLSGRASPVGKGIKNALELVVFDTQAPKIRWRFLDTQSTPSGTKQAVLQLVNDPPHVILGPLFHTHTQIVRNMVDVHIPILSFSNANIANADNVYYFGYALQPQGKGIAHIVLQIGKQNPLIVLPDNIYGKTLYKGIQTVFPNQPVLYYKPNRLTYAEFIQQIPNTYAYDSVIMDDNNPQTIRTLTSEMDFYNVFSNEESDTPIPIIGGTGWSNVQNIHKEPTLIGAYFLTMQVKTADMVARYSQYYDTPSSNLTTLAYDLAYLAIGTLATDTPKAYLKSPKGFNGIRGYFRILDDNTIERIYNVYQVQKRGSKWRWKLPIDTTLIDHQPPVAIETTTVETAAPLPPQQRPAFKPVKRVMPIRVIKKRN